MIKFLKNLLPLLLAFSIAFAASGCRSSEKTDDTSSSASFSKGDISDIQSNESTGSNGSNSTDSKSTDSGSKNSQGAEGIVNNNGAKPGNGSWKEILAAMPKKFRGTQIELFHWNPVTELPGGEKLLKDFQKKTGIKIKWTVASYDNYDVELQSRVAANKSPDIVLFQWMNASRMALTQPIENINYDFSGNDWDKSVKSYYSVNGKTYAVNMNGTLLNRPAAIFYNKSLIEKYDFEDPYRLWKNGKWTESKFMEMCREYKKLAKGPAWVVSKFDVWTVLSGLQGEMSYKNGKYGNNLRDTKSVAAWQRCASLFEEGLIDRSWDAVGFENGKYLFMDTSMLYTRTTQPYFASIKSGGTLGIVPYFTVDGQKEYYQPMDEYEAYGIAKGSKNAEAVPYFLRYYLDPANYNSKTFFCSSNALEVYEFCMKQPNRIMHNRYPLGSGNSTSPVKDLRLALEGATSAQVPSILNSYIGIVDSCVADLNKRLGALK